MHKMFRKLQEMTVDEVNGLITVLLASLLGTMGSGIFLKWALQTSNDLGFWGRLLASVAATLVYGVIIYGVFYLWAPQGKLALKKDWIRRKDKK